VHPELQALLRQRIAVIADHSWRDRDAESHLMALQEVSLAITAWAEDHRGELDAKLRHYLGNASYQKALAHLSEGEE
jgi:hypothetical protein